MSYGKSGLGMILLGGFILFIVSSSLVLGYVLINNNQTIYKNSTLTINSINVRQVNQRIF